MIEHYTDIHKCMARQNIMNQIGHRSPKSTDIATTELSSRAYLWTKCEELWKENLSNIFVYFE